MSEMSAQYDEEFKKNAVKLSYASPKSVKQVADDLFSKSIVRKGVVFRIMKYYNI